MSFKNHLPSKKHRKNEREWTTARAEGVAHENRKMMKKGAKVQVVEAEQRDSTYCLFSNYKSATIAENLEYMNRHYGFFILHKDSCINKDGLIAALTSKIVENLECLKCCISKI